MTEPLSVIDFTHAAPLLLLHVSKSQSTHPPFPRLPTTLQHNMRPSHAAATGYTASMMQLR